MKKVNEIITKWNTLNIFDLTCIEHHLFNTNAIAGNKKAIQM
jgi:hypothetical protein